MAHKINAKQRLFVAKYTQIGSETYGNATKAAISAGYSAKSAYIQGSKLLRLAKIKAAMTAKSEKQLEAIDFSVEKVLRGIANLAMFDPRKFYNPDGSLRSIPDLDYDTACALAGFEVDKLFEHFGKGGAKEVGTTTKIKMADRLSALRDLGRYHKLFTEKIEVNASEELVEKLMAGRKRLAK